MHFSYEPTRAILKGLTFEVPANAKVAIVGPSGAGKSTISRLLFRFYDVSSGRITIDGQDIRDVSQDSLRAAIGIVPQDTVLFNDTIGYNIRYGRWDAGDEEVREAARMAQVARFIESLPARLRHAGRRTRAQALRRREAARRDRPHDPERRRPSWSSTRRPRRSIRRRSGRSSRRSRRSSHNRTALVIAHRLSTVVNADRIIVLEDGVIAEQGTHGELLARGGLYAAMWERQREVDEIAERLRRTREEARAFIPPAFVPEEAAE